MANTAVVGGGIIGASIASELARAGVAVTIFDRGELGAEASTAGAGMLAPGGEIDSTGRFSELMLQSARMYPEWVAMLEAESGIQIDYRRCGGLDIARSGDDWAQLYERGSRQQAMGIAIETHSDGLFYPDDAIVNPGDVMRALRIVCEKRGVRLCEDHAIHGGTLKSTSIELDGEQFDRAVLCAGAWSSQISIRGAELPVAFPVKGHLLGYHLPAGSVPHILRHGHTYILQRSTGFTIAGSSTENAGFNKSVDTAVAADLQQRAQQLLPMLEDLTATVWTGLRPGAAKPAIGRYQNSALWLAYGHYRNGILAAPATAKHIARQIIASLETD